MRNILLFIAVLLCTATSFAQIGSDTSWTWIKGDNTIGQFGIYGSKGLSDPGNKPGARNSAATWRDANGHLWMFGGLGCIGFLNDLWKYNPGTNDWTWMKGDNVVDQSGIYGIKGVPGAANKPGARYVSVSWTDLQGNLWLFGGFGFAGDQSGFLNDLWKFTVSTNEWTWVSGANVIDEVARYGTQGLPNTSNVPGGRYGSETWIDAAGQLWLFGGYGLDGNVAGILNDLWKFDPVTNKWTWIKGNDAVDQPGVYGERGVFDVSNQPGARYVSSSWADAEGNFWLFGGYGFDKTSSGNLNDLWKYDISTNNWTWIEGDDIIDQKAVYGVQGVANASNKPGARYISTAWTDMTGNLWMFGGYGYDDNNSGYLNDLWSYSPSTGEWTWVKGDNTIDQLGVYGTQGMPAPSNKTGARTGSETWTDGMGNLWLFGGYGFDGSSSGILNDLWKVTTLIPLPSKIFYFKGVARDGVINLQWQSGEERNFSHYNVQRSFDGIHYTTIGTVTGKGQSRNDYIFTDSDLANPPGQKIFYRLQITDRDGGFTYSTILGFDLKKVISDLQVYPNPAVHDINISFDQIRSGMVEINISDMKGRIIKKQVENLPAGKISLSIDVSALPSSVYILSITNTSGSKHHRFAKQ